MLTKHKHELIKSPFPVVNEYEGEFVRDWNRNTAEAVATLLKYIARATASAIKQYSPEEVIEDSIEKGRPKKNWTIGDTFTRHGITYRCTGISPNTGRPTWSKVDKGNKKLDIWQIDPIIDKLKTSKECQEYVMKLGYMSYSSDITTVDLRSAKFICSAMIHLHDFIPFERIKLRTKKLCNATMQACNGEWIEINSNYFTNFDPDKYYKSTHEDYRKDVEQSYDCVVLVINTVLQKDPQADVTKLIKKRDQLLQLKNCGCWTVGEKDSLAADIFLHEMGHILNAQCTGACGHWKTATYQLNHTPKEQQLHKQLNDERDSIFRRYKKDKTVVSEYSTTEAAEFFAECFVAWLHKDKKLPKYVKDYFDKYFKETTPKR
jgi:hypothetical protein